MLNICKVLKTGKKNWKREREHKSAKENFITWQLLLLYKPWANASEVSSEMDLIAIQENNSANFPNI